MSANATSNLEANEAGAGSSRKGSAKDAVPPANARRASASTGNASTSAVHHAESSEASSQTISNSGRGVSNRVSTRERSSSSSNAPSLSGRFSWVRRLMNNSTAKQHPVSTPNRVRTSQRTQPGAANTSPLKNKQVESIEAFSENVPQTKQPKLSSGSPMSSSKSFATNDYDLNDDFSASSRDPDQFSGNDNISTIPILSLSSSSFTTSRSDQGDEMFQSTGASTLATSVAPTTQSSPVNQSQNNTGLLLVNGGAPTGLDSASVITIASSTRHRRRRSIDTNASMSAIPPASIFERIIPSNTAASIHTNAPTVNTRYNVSTGVAQDCDSIQDVKSIQTSYTTRTNEESFRDQQIEASI